MTEAANPLLFCFIRRMSSASLFSNRARAKEARRCTARSGLFSAMVRSRRSAGRRVLLAGVLPIRMIFGSCAWSRARSSMARSTSLVCPPWFTTQSSSVNGRGVVGGRLASSIMRATYFFASGLDATAFLRSSSVVALR